MLLKPGQFCTINNHVFRAKKKTAGCYKCFFENCVFCPAVRKKGVDDPKRIDCGITGIILVKI